MEVPCKGTGVGSRSNACKAVKPANLAVGATCGGRVDRSRFRFKVAVWDGSGAFGKCSIVFDAVLRCLHASHGRAHAVPGMRMLGDCGGVVVQKLCVWMYGRSSSRSSSSNSC